MPVYEYEHTGKSCSMGRIFSLNQSIHDKALIRCPLCDNPVKKIISIANISTPKGNSELKDMGFTKLVRRDNGVYENVTARNGDSRYVIGNKPETLPNLSKTIRD